VLPDEVERLRERYTGQYVEVASQRPELARFQGQTGRIRTVNLNGLALVQFEGANQAWFDLPIDDLRVVENPQAKAE